MQKGLYRLDGIKHRSITGKEATQDAQATHLFNLSVADPTAVPILLTGALRKHTQVRPRQVINQFPMPFSADGRWLVGFGGSYGSGGTLLFNLRIRELVELARRTAGRELTDEEMEFFSLNDPD